jgi:lysine 2,3-aminomutase
MIQTHFQTPLEITPEAKKAIQKIHSAGWTITNQLVYNVAASRRGHTAKLRQALNALGVLCYYTFSVKGFEENYTVFTPNCRSIQEGMEEKQYGRMTARQAKELYALLENTDKPDRSISRFMHKHRLPFLATDRNVLNLPAIGKSMTFEMIGLTENGKRILLFDHDRTRRHSPIIDKLGKVFILENKSVAAYLRQLAAMGENPEDYATIWNYTRGETEPPFKLYEYPPFDFRITDTMSNLEIGR